MPMSALSKAVVAASNAQAVSQDHFTERTSTSAPLRRFDLPREFSIRLGQWRRRDYYGVEVACLVGDQE